MGTDHHFITRTSEEAELLIFVIDTYLDGYPAAEDATVADRTIETPEQLLDLMGGYEEQKRLLLKFRGRLLEDVIAHGGSVAPRSA